MVAGGEGERKLPGKKRRGPELRGLEIRSMRLISTRAVRTGFGHELEELRPGLERFARRRGATAEQSEDLVQEAMLRAVQAGIEPGELRPWLHVVVRHLLIDLKRTEARRQRALRRIIVDRPEADHADEIIDLETARALRMALETLPPTQAGVLRALSEGETLRSFAARMGMSVRAAEGHLRRARSKLRELVPG